MSPERLKRYSRNAASSVRLAAPERLPRFVFSIEHLQNMSARGPKRLVVGRSADRNFIKRVKSIGRLPRLRNRHGSSDK